MYHEKGKIGIIFGRGGGDKCGQSKYRPLRNSAIKEFLFEEKIAL
jgi:hypothetical protein